MDRQSQHTAGKQVPPHEFALIEVIGATKNAETNRWEGGTNQTIGYAVTNELAKYPPAFKVVVVNDAGEVVDTDYIIDSGKSGDLYLKFRQPETREGKTYDFTLLGTLFAHPSKQVKGALYYRASTMPKEGEVQRQFRMFPNDGKFAPNPKMGT